MHSKPTIISIDGFASTGKSTLAKKLANHLNYKHVDSGSIYRAVTLLAINKGIFILDGFDVDKLKKMLNNLSLNFKDKTGLLCINNKPLSKNIRSHEVSEKVSQIAKISFVRLFALNQLRSLKINKGIVIEGRDIGTIVFPKANCKFFFTASIDLRVRRRWNEMKEKGDEIPKKEVQDNLNFRDRMDSERNVSPLKKAEDAIEIDVSNLNINEVFEMLLKHIKEKKIK